MSKMRDRYRPADQRQYNAAFLYSETVLHVFRPIAS